MSVVQVSDAAAKTDQVASAVLNAANEIAQFKPETLRIAHIEPLAEIDFAFRKLKPLAGDGVVPRNGLVAHDDAQLGEEMMRDARLAFRCAAA